MSRDDVLGSWAGLRPLVRTARTARTADLSRRHTLHLARSGLITVTGGKLTTYRRMAADAVDAASRLLGHRTRCRTKRMRLHGAGGANVSDPARATSDALDNHLGERYGNEAVLIGFSTYSGTVTAASNWNAPHERKRLRPALAGSYEKLFHETAQERGQRDFLVFWRGNQMASSALLGPRLERAIGVIYLPQTERISHYFRARMPEQFDAVIHFDETVAVEPLDRTSLWESGEEVPETYPYAV